MPKESSIADHSPLLGSVLPGGQDYALGCLGWGARTRVFPLKTVQCYGQTSSYGAHGAYPGRGGW